MKLILLALVMVFIGCGTKPEKKVVPVEKHPVLKSKEELKQEFPIHRPGYL